MSYRNCLSQILLLCVSLIPIIPISANTFVFEDLAFGFKFDFDSSFSVTTENEGQTVILEKENCHGIVTEMSRIGIGLIGKEKKAYESVREILLLDLYQFDYKEEDSGIELKDGWVCIYVEGSKESHRIINANVMTNDRQIHVCFRVRPDHYDRNIDMISQVIETIRDK
jgi:hypothetical protein